ncbi:AraC family transcriptional regulator [Streptomyces thermodiastaticus]|jgi:AraC-like DNA-binding protein|uniref:AraC family transcriptional regulator n=1 Tax=Streptomyces thermodiastaticus TaxID=44061 RepID=UPI001678587D|nr:AraC family transcriptional regulator [Streptomyces thermodiastaticus]MCE7552562.1 AraC family transcriptional regulator [Streptomyces thermodiastaticus]GHF87430.1 AraC family transcriptional regulator [Streptomyces thermodiastaticus]
MAGDQLSEVFDLIEVRGHVTGGFAVRGPWVARAKVDAPVKFLAMVCGRARLSTDGLDEPVPLEAGDVAVLNGRSWLEVEGGTGEGQPREVEPEEGFDAALAAVDRALDDVLLGGRVELNAAGEALLGQALPPVGHVRASAAEAVDLRGTLDRLFQEATAGRMGSAFAVRQYTQLLLLDVLRAYVDQTDLPPGWLRLLSDERLRPALGLLHAEPGRPWRLQELARAAAMSRTSFAQRFRTVAGVPPLTYLHRWRMLLAQRALQADDTRVGALADELGYSSESAFSTAFKREMGVSPLHYRRRMRERRA